MYSEIIPGAIQDRLLILRDAVTDLSWQIGDITHEIFRWNHIKGTDYTREQICSAVGSFVGKKSRTVREYQYLSILFPEVLRERFNMLAFAHFRQAATLGTQADAIKALEWAVAQTDFVGRPATVDAMIAQFSPPPPGEPEAPPSIQQTPLEMIYQTVSRQVDLVNGWIGYDLPGPVKMALAEYYKAARVLKTEIEQGAAVMA